MVAKAERGGGERRRRKVRRKADRWRREGAKMVKEERRGREIGGGRE